MINTIETLVLDFKNLKNNEEINSYIIAQLTKNFPEPELLIFDYIIIGNRLEKKILVSYGLREDLENIPSKELTHPHLLFRSLLRKDGHYVIFYHSRVLEVTINKGIITDTKHDYIIDHELEIQLHSIIISDQKNLSRCYSIYSGDIKRLEDLYNKCKKNLFKCAKKSKIPILLISLVCSILVTILSYKLHNCYTQSFTKLKQVKDQYTRMISDNETKNDLDLIYNDLLQITLNNESQLPPDIYGLLYELNMKGYDYKILSLNYYNRFLVINAISKNSITLVESLNTSDILNLTQNSTVTKEDYEQVNFSGDVICP